MSRGNIPLPGTVSSHRSHISVFQPQARLLIVLKNISTPLAAYLNRPFASRCNFFIHNYTMFAADLSWTEDAPLRVGERRAQQAKKAQSQRPTTRDSGSSSTETSRSPFKMLDLPLRRLKGGAPSRRGSLEKVVSNNTTTLPPNSPYVAEELPVSI
jgi:hypothetical protein